MAEKFKYRPEWEGPLSGRSFEKQTEDAINALWAAIESIGGGGAPSDALPQAPGTANPGTSTLYSRGDHVHPAQVFPVDAALDGDSDNPVANSAIVTALGGKVGKTGDEAIAGAKTFSQGPYGTTAAIESSEINLAGGVVFSKTISEDTTFTFAGVPAGAAAKFFLILTNGGAYEITWPETVQWSGVSRPLLSADGVDMLTFVTPDGGASWYGIGGGARGSGNVTETLLWEGDLSTGSFDLPVGDAITNYDYLMFVVDFTSNYPGRYTQIYRAADCVSEQKLYIGNNTRYVYGWFSTVRSFYIQNAANARTRKLYGIKL